MRAAHRRPPILVLIYTTRKFIVSPALVTSAASYPLGCRVPRAGADYPRRTGDVAEGDAAVMADRKLAVAVV